MTMLDTSSDTNVVDKFQTYAEKLQTLSEGSVHQNFDPFLDIDWDHPDFAIEADDPRWVLPEADALGRHPWYKAQPLADQIRIGLWRQANVAKVGLQFENVLIQGLMQYVFTLPNGSPEFRYCTHEATEETHHTQMFQEFVNRAGVDVPGGPWHFRLLAPILPLAARFLPNVFFIGVLAGEEPIDHIQKLMLRTSDNHPLLQRVMQIHVAEEARHISFAHARLKQEVPHAGPLRKGALSLAFPVVMRVLGDTILIPNKAIMHEVGVPKWVLKEVFWNSDDGREMRRNVFADVRMLADQLGLMNPISKRLWRLLGIDGKASRFRSEPAH